MPHESERSCSCPTSLKSRVQAPLLNAVDTLGMAVLDPPTQAEVQQIADKLDGMILALRR